MSRVINPESAGKTRNRLVKAMVISIRELFSQPEINDASLDVAAFIALTLEAIAQTIEPTIEPWEKRGYWVKADRFRMEWSWAGKYSSQMRHAVIDEDWPRITEIAVKVGEQVSGVKVSERHRMGTPWVGAWEQLSAMN